MSEDILLYTSAVQEKKRVQTMMSEVDKCCYFCYLTWQTTSTFIKTADFFTVLLLENQSETDK